jgi:1,2-diacylglycerol 3-alpha-glucosyltransferase
MNGGKSFLEFVEMLAPLKRGESKIAILMSLFKKHEGASVVAKQQAKRLSEKGYEVFIYTFESNINFDPSYKVKIKVIRPSIQSFYNRIYRGLFFLDIPVLISLLRELRCFDLIIIHHGNMAVLGYLAKKLYGVKVVFWNHHIDTNVGLLHKVYEAMNWRFIRRFDYVVSISRFSRDMLKSLTGIESFVIYNEVDERFREGLNGDIVRKKYGLGREDPLLLFVGRIVQRKNVHLLIEVFNLIKKEIPTAKLLIVGRRDDEEYYRRLLKIADNSVIFEENVPDDEIPLYYAACDVYVTCSAIEGFNLPLAEAQACGKPVVAFDLGPHREIVKRGYLVKPYDMVDFKEKVIELLRASSLEHGKTSVQQL